MRLIDADALMGRIADMKWKYTDDANATEIIGMQYANTMNDLALDLIHRTPTAYDIDKVVEELELHSFEMGTDTLPAHYVRLNKAIEIVKQGLKEQK